MAELYYDAPDFSTKIRSNRAGSIAAAEKLTTEQTN